MLTQFNNFVNRPEKKTRMTDIIWKLCHYLPLKRSNICRDSCSYALTEMQKIIMGQRLVFISFWLLQLLTSPINCYRYETNALILHNFSSFRGNETNTVHANIIITQIARDKCTKHQMQNWFRMNIFSYSNGGMISKSFRAIKFVFTFILAPSHYRYYCNYLLIKVIEFAVFHLPFTRRHLSYCFDRLIFQANSPFPFGNLRTLFAICTTSAAFMTFSFFFRFYF